MTDSLDWVFILFAIVATITFAKLWNMGELIAASIIFLSIILTFGMHMVVVALQNTQIQMKGGNNK